MTAPPELEPLPARPCAALYIATVAAFLVFCATLALQSRSYGSPDSMTNLQTARCFAAGEGVTSHVVAQVLVPQPDVHRERLRSPGVPILFGLLFLVFAPAPWLPVAFNAWVEAVAALPSDAVVFAAAPWEVAWYAGRAAVRTPLARRDLVRVARHYQVTHALQLGPRAAREGGELLQALAPDLLSAGPSWALHAIRIVPAGVQPSQSHLAPEGPRRD